LKSSRSENVRSKKETENLKQRNAENLQQTQEGIKTFKTEINTLKTELQKEKSKTKELKAETETAAAAAKDADAAKEAADSRIKDLEDKWAKSKRINQQRKEKIESLEKQISTEKAAGLGIKWCIIWNYIFLRIKLYCYYGNIKVVYES